MNFSISPTVKWLIILNVCIWFIGQVILDRYAGIPISKTFSLVPAEVIFEFKIWQVFTYMFLHSLSVSHILFNMLMLWFMGSDLEGRWGRKYFLLYYVLTGIGAAIVYCVGQYLWFRFVNPMGIAVPVQGASGALFGIMLAYGILFGERVIHVMMVFPMKAKYMVMIFGAVEVASLMTSDSTGGGVAYLAHLGGLLSGYLVLVSTTWIQRAKWNNKMKKRTKNLKLVVNNKNGSDSSSPKYWN